MANLESSPQKPRRSRPPRTKERSMPSHDVDLTGGFRLDMKTIVLLAGILGAWYDQRARQEQQAAISAIQSQTVRDSLQEIKGVQKAQQYDLNAMKLALAEKGIKIKEN